MKNIKINVSLKNKDSLKKEIESLLNTQSFKIDTTAFTKSISAMSKELNKLKSQLSGFNILDGSNTKNVTQATQEVDKLVNSMSKIDKLKFNLQNKLNTAMNNELVNTSVIDNLQNKLNSLNSNTAEREILELKTAINNLSSGDSGIVRVQQAIITLEQRIASIKSKNGIDIINQNEINEVKQAEAEVKKLKAMLGQLTTGDVIDGKKISSSINTATNSVRTLENSFRSVNTSASGLGNTIRSIFSYGIGGSGIYLFVRSLKDTFDTVVELDTKMRDLRRVTEETEATYSQFMRTANDTAIALGTTTTGAIEATTRFSQLGYSFGQASEELSKYALVLSNVADMSAKDSSSAIVSTLKGFGLETEEVGRIVDVINEAGNRFAIDSGGLADALRIGSANLSLAGNDLEQASAMIITANEIMQDPTTVANGLKTISINRRVA